jgi:hypothetical protein
MRRPILGYSTQRGEVRIGTAFTGRVLHLQNASVPQDHELRAQDVSWLKA